MNIRRPIVLIACLALTAFGLILTAAAQTPPAAPKPLTLSVESIMRGPDLVGTEPSVVGWSMDGQKFYFRWKKPAEKTAEVYSSPRKTSFRRRPRPTSSRTGRSRRRLEAADSADSAGARP